MISVVGRNSALRLSYLLHPQYEACMLESALDSPLTAPRTKYRWKVKNTIGEEQRLRYQDDSAGWWQGRAVDRRE